MLSQASAINMQNNRATEQRLINKRVITPNSRYKYYINGTLAPSAMPSNNGGNGPYKYLMNGSLAPPSRRKRPIMPSSKPLPNVLPQSQIPTQNQIGIPTMTVKSLTMKPGVSLVSVVMVTENNLNTMRQSIYTILKQSHTNVELIIVDNNSNDGTLDFIKSLTDTRIKTYALKETTTLANCRNIGLYMSKGDYITFQNPTYVSTSERLTKQINSITDNSSSVVGESINDTLDKVNFNYESLMINRNQFNKFGFFQNIPEHLLEYTKRLIKNKVQISNLSELYYLKYNSPPADSPSYKALESFADVDVSVEPKVAFVDLNRFNI